MRSPSHQGAKWAETNTVFIDGLRHSETQKYSPRFPGTSSVIGAYHIHNSSLSIGSLAKLHESEITNRIIAAPLRFHVALDFLLLTPISACNSGSKINSLWLQRLWFPRRVRKMSLCLGGLVTYRRRKAKASSLIL